MTSSRMNRVIEILDHVQSDIEQILLLLKMKEEEPTCLKTCVERERRNHGCTRTDISDIDKELLDNALKATSARYCTRTDLDESANEKLKQFLNGFAYLKPKSED